MILAEHDKMVEALRLDREDPALRVGNQIRSCWADRDWLDAFGGEDAAELRREVPVEVVNQVSGSMRFLLGEQDEVSSLLRHTAGIRMRCQFSDNRTARTNSLANPRPATLTVAPLGSPRLGLQPALERRRRDNGDQVVNRRSDRFAVLQEPSPFSRRELHPVGQLASQNLVFDLEVLHLPSEFTLGGGERCENLEERVV